MLVIAIFAVNVSAIALTRAEIRLADFSTFYLITVLSGLAYLACQKFMDRDTAPRKMLIRITLVIEAMIFSQLSVLSLQLLNYISMMQPFPYVDNMLNSADESLGVDWLAYFEMVHASPLLVQVLERIYDSLAQVGFLAIYGLILTGHVTRARFFIEAFFLTALVCVLVGMFFPALAAVDMYVADLAAYPNFPNPPGVYHIELLENLRANTGPAILDPNYLPGLVTFPSFHAGGSIVLLIAFWRMWAAIPVGLFTLGTLASTPVFGGHYIIDMVGGAGVAIVVCAVLGRQARFRAIFDAARPRVQPVRGTPAEA